LRDERHCETLCKSPQISSVQTPVLQTERLILRPFELDDASKVQQLAGNRAIADTTLNVPHPYEDGMAEAWISTHGAKSNCGELIFAITMTGNGELVGATCLRVDNPFARAELGYWIAEPYWGKGYCSEAATRLLRFAFADLQLNRVHASYLARNPASGRVLQKIGMSKEGVARQHTMKWDRFEDLVLCGILRNEWQARKGS
jgi:RimJ/RimL family protein N-acetyltransferase